MDDAMVIFLCDFFLLDLFETRFIPSRPHFSRLNNQLIESQQLWKIQEKYWIKIIGSPLHLETYRSTKESGYQSI